MSRSGMAKPRPRSIVQSAVFEHQGKLSGEFAILSGAEPGRVLKAVLTNARVGSGKFRPELAQRAGIFSLSLPSTTGQIIVFPQLRTITVRHLKRERKITFDDHTAVRRLDSALRRDKTWLSRSRAFFVAAVAGMIELEITHGISFPLLDQVVESREQFRMLAQRGGKKPGKAGWGGVELGCFIPCMEECEGDADWWEVWVHAECLVRCGIKCGTGGGPIFPD
jgi:hypothetical protein